MPSAKAIRGSVVESTVRAGDIYEWKVKSLLKDADFEIFDCMATGRPIDVYAEKRYNNNKFSFGVIVESIDEPNTNFLVPPYGMVARFYRGKRYKFSKGQIPRARFEVFAFLKGTNRHGKTVAISVVVTSGKINHGYDVAYNHTLKCFFVQEFYFPIWLRKIQEVYLGQPKMASQ